MRLQKRVVVVGHGMVGHRFVEALRSRDTKKTWWVTVLAEEREAAYDRVGLTGYTEHWDRTALALPGGCLGPRAGVRRGPRQGRRASDVLVWTAACAYDRLLASRGVGVLLPCGRSATSRSPASPPPLSPNVGYCHASRAIGVVKVHTRRDRVGAYSACRIRPPCGSGSAIRGFRVGEPHSSMVWTTQ